MAHYIISTTNQLGNNPTYNYKSVYIPKEFKDKVSYTDFIYDTAVEAADRMIEVLDKIDFVVCNLCEIMDNEGIYKGKVVSANKEYNLYSKVITNCINCIHKADIRINSAIELRTIAVLNDYGLIIRKVDADERLSKFFLN